MIFFHHEIDRLVGLVGDMCRSQDELKKEASMTAAVTLESVGAIDFTEAMA